MSRIEEAHPSDVTVVPDEAPKVQSAPHRDSLTEVMAEQPRRVSNV